MKLIMAIIREEKLENVKNALEEELDTSSMTVTDVKGRGKQKGLQKTWRGEKYEVEFLPKTKIEIVAKDEEANKIVETIQEKAKTGNIGDGKIFILPVEESIRIRTGETGKKAL